MLTEDHVPGARAVAIAHVVRVETIARAKALLLGETADIVLAVPKEIERGGSPRALRRITVGYFHKIS